VILKSGTRLGAYEIVSPLGSGGMGEVYRARDRRLGREVAIKILPSPVANDPERLSRFESEARAASALNHPNIVTVHEVGRESDISWIAMELVDGASLRSLLMSGPLPVRKLLALAPQIADGLAKAHSAGIVHRDLKPENVMVSSDGFVKIVDFGLAKLAPIGPQASLAPTDALPETLTGKILGTISYMSPEQATGRDVDYRSDQFSFGSILYEMVTGRTAFARESVIDTLSAIVHDNSEPIAPGISIPPALRWTLDR
jgi:serine/threonine protein kinase